MGLIRSHEEQEVGRTGLSTYPVPIVEGEGEGEAE
jgi:hypothetical protein